MYLVALKVCVFNTHHNIHSWTHTHAHTHHTTPVFGSPESPLVPTDGDPDKDRSNKRSEVGSDTTERESKVHALGEEGVHTTSDTPGEVPFQYPQKLIHLFHNVIPMMRKRQR